MNGGFRSFNVAGEAHGTIVAGDDSWTGEIPMADPLPPLETFPNGYPGREYEIEHRAPEFTSVCPKTGQPDFGVLTFRYVPDALCVELKSLKMYLQAYRNRGIFYENVINAILDDFVAACRPLRCEVIGEFSPRGGLSSRIIARHVAKQG